MQIMREIYLPLPVLSSKRNRVILAGAVFLLALAIRIVSNASHFFSTVDPGYRNFEMCDSSYQIRRSEMIVDNFPRVPFKDSYHYYPDQPDVPWPPGYNLFLASFGKITQIFGGDRLAQETTMGLVPSFVDALTTLLFLLLAAQFMPFWSASIAGLLLALSTQNVGYAEVGYVDHHYFITFLIVVLAWLFHRYEIKKDWKSAVALGSFAGSVTFFNVSSIQYSLMALMAVGVHAFWRRAEAPMQKRPLIVFSSALFFSFFSSLSTPVGRAFAWRYDQTSLFQFGLVLALTLLYVAIALSWKKDKKFNWMPAAVSSVFLLALGIFLFKDIWKGAQFLFVGNLLNYIQGEETSFREYYPLWATVFTWSVFFVPFGLAQIRKWFNDRPGFTALFFLFFVHGLLTGLSHFLYVQYFFPWLAFSAAYGMQWFVEKKYSWLKSAWYFVLVVFMSQAFYVGYVETFNINNGEGGARIALKQTIQAFAWLREHSPQTSHFEFGDGKPEYSVMAHRDHGHMIVRIAHRPVVVSPFSTPDFVDHMKDYARLSLSANEEEAVDIMNKYKSRYLILDHRDNTMTNFLAQILKNDSDAEEYETKAKQSKMTFFRNNLLYFDGELRWKKTPPVKRFRLIYEAPLQVEIPLTSSKGIIKHKYNGLKIFELVKGATIKGTGYRANELVKFNLPLQTNTTRIFNYTTFVLADSKGDIAVNVPYSTENKIASGVTLKAGAYEAIRGNGAKKFLFISENDVLEGKAINFPAF